MTPQPPKRAIVFLTLSYHPLVGGTELQVKQLGERLAARGHEIWVVTRSVPGRPDEERIGGVRVIRVRSSWRRYVAWLSYAAAVARRLWPERRRIRMAIIQALNAGTPPGLLLSAWPGVRVGVRLTAGGAAGNIGQLWGRRLGRAAIRALLQRCDFAIAISGQIIAELEQAGFPRDKVRLIPNGVDTERFRPASADERRANRRLLGIDDDQFLVLFVGRLDPLKNLDTLVRAWSAFSPTAPKARLAIVGEGEVRNALESLVSSERTGTTIRLAGEDADVSRWYLAADAFVLPSHSEGLSNALLEAIASGLPCLASRVGGNTDVLGGWADEALVPATDVQAWVAALRRIATDEAWRKAIANGARRLALERYSFAASIAGYERLLDETAGVP